ncbi:hypothetical protein F0562_002696 [Nyssa sinensis]|uniref:WAT1-related protein n=1 Tax=Nyssa sinensis TaxID=561372 RepID=A0A5J5BU61_9ASTE|nr:hypothetical protein F0562_002696 [Nyssa sinensis]
MKALRCCANAMGNNKPYIAIIIIQFIYAGMSLFSKAAISEGMKPAVFVAYRQGFAALALVPFALLLKSKKTAPLSWILLCKIFFVSLCGITLCLNLYTYGLNYTSATFATAMTNTIPVMVFIMAVAFRMESVSIREWHGIAKVMGSVIGLSGAMVFTFYKGPSIYHSSEKASPKASANHISKGDWVKGALIMLAANLTWSLWLIMLRPIIKQYPDQLRLTTLQCFFSCIMSALWAAVMERNISSWKLGWDINLLSVAYCGVVVTGLSYWLQVWVVEKKGPVFTAIFSPLALILTAIFSAIFFKENLHWGSVCGAVLLVAGLYSYLWGKNTEAKSEKSEQKAESKEESPTLECVSTQK